MGPKVVKGAVKEISVEHGDLARQDAMGKKHLP